MDNYLGNIANAAINKEVFLKQLVVTNLKEAAMINTQASTTKSLTNDNKRLTKQIKSLKNKLGSRSTPAIGLASFMKECYCWLHQYKIKPGPCGNKKDGHNVKATHDGITNDRTWNKGWDD